jgi:hypothetical protein
LNFFYAFSFGFYTRNQIRKILHPENPDSDRRITLEHMKLNRLTPGLCVLIMLLTSFSLPVRGPQWTAEKYRVKRTSGPLKIDGKPESTWDDAPWSTPFVDIEGDKKPTPTLGTRIKMLYDDQFLYIFAEMEEPHLWGILTSRDAIIFRDNDFEVFLDPNNDQQQYFEYEINALGTVMDLFMPKPYKKGGKADLSWNSLRLQSAVALNGTLNDNTDSDKGWTVELAIPFKDMERPGRVHQPKSGDQWHINFSRVQWTMDKQGTGYVKRKGSNGKNLPESNWVWSPQGEINMHIPEKWGVIVFQ